jgi:hypothetical protein
MLKGAQGQNGRDTCLRSRIGQDLLIDKRGTHQHNNGMYALVPLIVHGYLIVLTKLPVFPEMKTALRTYHPVPSLQKTDGNAQDAPRIKNCLKAALLPSELKLMPPSTPEEILEKSVRVFVLFTRFNFTTSRSARTRTSSDECRQFDFRPREPRCCESPPQVARQGINFANL